VDEPDTVVKRVGGEVAPAVKVVSGKGVYEASNVTVSPPLQEIEQPKSCFNRLEQPQRPALDPVDDHVIQSGFRSWRGRLITDPGQTSQNEPGKGIYPN
jgi:hypothetical protein